MGCVCTRKSRKRKVNYNFEVLENDENEEKRNDNSKIKSYLIQIISTIISEVIKQKNYIFGGLKNEGPTKAANKTTKLIELENIGGNPFMNAILQCLSNTDKLTDYILNKFKNGKYDDTKKISYKYYDLLHHLWDKNSEDNSYAPESFKILFSEVKSFNSTDFLKFLLNMLHKELNKAQKEENNNINNNINQYNEEEVMQNFRNIFYQNNRSIISDIFYFTFETKSQCSNCRYIKYNFDYNFILDFPLDQIYQYLCDKEKSIPSVDTNGSYLDINLYDCFDYYKTIRLIDGFNQIPCNICNGYYNSYYSETLYSLTEILVISLDRWNVSQYNVNYPEELDLTNYVIRDKSNARYELFGVICHIGPYSLSGHNMAYCRNRKDGKWYLYNDSIVTLCENSYKYLKANPCILFYKSKNINNIQNNKNINNNLNNNSINNNINNNNNIIISNIKDNNFCHNNFYDNNFYNNNFYNNNVYNNNFCHNFNGNNIIEQNFRRINKNNINTNIINVYNSINQKESYGTYNNDEEKNQLHEYISTENKNIIFVEFLSLDQKIRYSIPCKKTDSFSKIEQKLYKKFPEYKDKNIYF